MSPDDPEALHLLGLVDEQEGNREGAIRLIEQAIAVFPQEPIFRLNLAAILERTGSLIWPQDISARLLKPDPTQAIYRHNLARSNFSAMTRITRRPTNFFRLRSLRERT